jgi:hypothetical protein
VQQALDAGYEVTIHEAPITQDGWTGAGLTIIDPNTGAGGYLIEGGSNGAWLAGFGQGASFAATVVILGIVAGTSIGTLGVVGGVLASIMLATILFTIQLIVLELATRNFNAEQLACYNGGFGSGASITAFAALVFGLFLTIAAKAVSASVSNVMSAIYSIPGLVAGMEFPSTDRPTCFSGS